jgi:hypothetical protein
MSYFRFLLIFLSSILLVSCEENSSEHVLQAYGLIFEQIYADMSAIKEISIKNMSNKYSAVAINFNLFSPYFNIINPHNCANISAGKTCKIKVKFAPQKHKNNYAESINFTYSIDSKIKHGMIALSGLSSVRINPPTDPIIDNKLKDDLTNLLTSRAFDNSQIKDYKKEYSLAHITYSVDDTGKFYAEDYNGKFLANLEWYKSNKTYEISSKSPARLPSNPLYVDNKNFNAMNAFAGMAITIRERGIYAMKSLNTECYYAYAAKRLKTKNPYPRLMAMERAVNPRPLVFIDDVQWEDFKKDIRELFKEFRGPKSHVVILGTSTSFFSQNPQKGMNSVLFESAPACIQRAKGPSSTNIYTFDTPNDDGTLTLSDIDIHVLIPELAALCEEYDKTTGNPANSGRRATYVENWVNRCFALSPNPEIRALVNANTSHLTLPQAVAPHSRFGKFFAKWEKILGKREIAFSVHIRPDQLRAPLTKWGESDFENDANLKRPFRIDIN